MFVDIVANEIGANDVPNLLARIVSHLAVLRRHTA